MSPVNWVRRASWAQRALATLMAAALVLLVLIFLGINSRAYDTCNQVNELRTSVRGILERGQSNVQHSTTLSPGARAQALEFYRRAIEDLEPHRC